MINNTYNIKIYDVIINFRIYSWLVIISEQLFICFRNWLVFKFLNFSSFLFTSLEINNLNVFDKQWTKNCNVLKLRMDSILAISRLHKYLYYKLRMPNFSLPINSPTL